MITYKELLKTIRKLDKKLSVFIELVLSNETDFTYEYWLDIKDNIIIETQLYDGTKIQYYFKRDKNGLLVTIKRKNINIENSLNSEGKCDIYYDKLIRHYDNEREFVVCSHCANKIKKKEIELVGSWQYIKHTDSDRDITHDLYSNYMICPYCDKESYIEKDFLDVTDNVDNVDANFDDSFNTLLANTCKELRDACNNIKVEDTIEKLSLLQDDMDIKLEDVVFKDNETLTYNKSKQVFSVYRRISCFDLVKKLPKNTLYDFKLLEFMRQIDKDEVMVEIFDDKENTSYLQFIANWNNLKLVFVFDRELDSLKTIEIVPITDINAFNELQQNFVVAS